jgi:polyhydroxybutyrate depolymerase
MRAIPLVLCVALALLAACGDDDSAGEAAPAQAEPCTRTLRAGDSVVRLRHDGLTRSARVHAPRGVSRTRPLPVVLVLHFAGGPARAMEGLTRFTPLADRERFVAVYPEAAGRRHFWTLASSAPSKPDDVGFLTALLDRLERDACTDPDRVYATGVSNGGGMAVRLA